MASYSKRSNPIPIHVDDAEARLMRLRNQVARCRDLVVNADSHERAVLLELIADVASYSGYLKRIQDRHDGADLEDG